MDEMLKKQDVLDAILAKIDELGKTNTSADVILGLAAAMSTVKQMQAAPVNPAEKEEPCTDAISREDALMALTGEYTDSPIEILPKAIKRINALPPVTPAEKVGRWILLDECSNSGYYCSKCQKKVVKEGWSNTVKKIKYCPNCGVKMEGKE